MRTRPNESSSWTSIALFFERRFLSDGVQGIATNMANHTPARPVLCSVFSHDGFGRSGRGRDDQLQASLAAFLSSERVNAKTDDDKTLALAVAVP